MTLKQTQINKCREICGPQWMMLNCMSFSGCFKYKHLSCSQKSLLGNTPVNLKCLDNLHNKMDECHECLYKSPKKNTIG